MKLENTILITGGAGFIGSNFILNFINKNISSIVNLDILTYAGNLDNLSSINQSSRYKFIKGDIADTKLVYDLLNHYKPYAVINFAAESHVDRSISNSSNFIHTNINGTHNLLEVSRNFFNTLTDDDKLKFRFIHISTDEVYGSLKEEQAPATENYPYKPNSPYSASKAASDHLVRSWYETYKLPAIISNCSNNYGPYQFPEKLIPLCIISALAGNKIPVYGDGLNIRDWLFVEDHCSAIESILFHGKIGEVYNIGGNSEKTNISVVNTICNILDDMIPISFNKSIVNKGLLSYKELITFVNDRPGHDRRYAIDSTKIFNELKWQPKENFGNGILKTVKWYINNTKWLNNILNRS